jgi:hypothetical protein
MGKAVISRSGPSTRFPALAGGSCSGFRPTAAVEGATGLPVGLGSNGNTFYLAGCCVDVVEVAGKPRRFQIPRRPHMLRIATDWITIDDFEDHGIDDGHVVGFSIRHVNARQMLRDRRAKLFEPGPAVRTIGVNNRRHAGNGFDHTGSGFRGAGDR